MKILGIDPGTFESGVVLWDTETGEVPIKGVFPNGEFRSNLVELLPDDGVDRIGIEMIASYGMPVGRDVFDTCVWIGVFLHRLHEHIQHQQLRLVTRGRAKGHMCHSPKASDSNVRQAVIDYFGGDLKAVGGKKCPECKGKGWVGRGRPTCPLCTGGKWQHPPGVLHGVKSHMFPALAVAIYVYEVSAEHEKEYKLPDW
jgi:hypothetical protein